MSCLVPCFSYIETGPPFIYSFIILIFTSFSGTGHITTGSLMGRGNQYIQLVKVL